jgi:hypothetical protein
MPTEFPQRRSRGLSRWHIAGMAVGYLTVTAVMLWVAVERAGFTDPVTTGIAPSSQSGKSLPRE